MTGRVFVRDYVRTVLAPEDANARGIVRYCFANAPHQEEGQHKQHEQDSYGSTHHQTGYAGFMANNAKSICS